MNTYLIVHPVPDKLNQIIKKPAYVIAVDQGLFDAYKQGVNVDLAIGDFDSLVDLRLLEGIKTIKLNSVKDVTDTESALKYAQTLGSQHIYILGGLGGFRFEHSYANLLLLFEYDNVSIISNDTQIVKYDKGIYETTFQSFVNIFTPLEATISLKGFKYDLNKYNLKHHDRLGISNEIKGEKGIIEVIDGSIIVMYSKKEQ